MLSALTYPSPYHPSCHTRTNITTKGAGGSWEVRHMFRVLMAVMVLQVYTYSQTHSVLCIKYVQLFTC